MGFLRHRENRVLRVRRRILIGVLPRHGRAIGQRLTTGFRDPGYGGEAADPRQNARIMDGVRATCRVSVTKPRCIRAALLSTVGMKACVLCREGSALLAKRKIVPRARSAASRASAASTMTGAWQVAMSVVAKAGTVLSMAFVWLATGSAWRGILTIARGRIFACDLDAVMLLMVDVLRSPSRIARAPAD